MVTPSGLVVLTDRRLAAGSLPEVVAAAIRGGAGWVVLRERDLPYVQRRALAAELRDIVSPSRLIVAGPDPLGGDAVHLAEADPLPTVRPCVTGRSCHAAPTSSAPTSSAPICSAPICSAPICSAAICSAAPARDAMPARDAVPDRTLSLDGMSDMSVVDYVTLSPIFPTATKPGYGPALGPRAAARLAAAAFLAGSRVSAGGSAEPAGGELTAGGLPWLALGGIDSPERAAACAAAGAGGIAVLGAVMRAADPEAVCRSLATAFAAARIAGAFGDPSRPTSLRRASSRRGPPVLHPAEDSVVQARPRRAVAVRTRPGRTETTGWVGL